MNLVIRVEESTNSIQAEPLIYKALSPLTKISEVLNFPGYSGTWNFTGGPAVLWVPGIIHFFLVIYYKIHVF